MTTTTAPATAQVPLVDYLVLDPPHLVAHECTNCAARFFDRRNACARCGKTEFHTVDVDNRGTVTAYTIVAYAAPGVEVPFVAATINCGGTSVRANIINTPADPDHIKLDMPVQLTTFVVGEDTVGTQAIGYAYEPVEGN